MAERETTFFPGGAQMQVQVHDGEPRLPEGTQASWTIDAAPIDTPEGPAWQMLVNGVPHGPPIPEGHVIAEGASIDGQPLVEVFIRWYTGVFAARIEAVTRQVIAERKAGRVA